MKEIPFERSYASEKSSEEWDYEKNDGITPKDVCKGSDKKYWFKCKKCSHSYYQRLNKRTSYNRSCSYCSNKLLCKNECKFCFNNSYASEKNSEEWDYEKNELTPKEVFTPLNI